MDSVTTINPSERTIYHPEGNFVQKRNRFIDRGQATRREYCQLTLIGACLMISAMAQADQVTVDGRDFMPVFGNAVYAESGAGNLVCTEPNGSQFFIAQLPLPPTPAVLDLRQIAIWGGDFSPADITVNIDRLCQAEFSASTPLRTSIASLGSSGNSGNYFDSVTLNRRIDDQRTCVYMINLEIGCSGNSNLSLARVRARFDVVPAVVVDPIFRNGFEG